jgi:transposase
MASLITKDIKGHDYYYLVESKRVNGKPKYRNQLYLGPVDSVHEKLREGFSTPTPLYSKVFEFGGIAALYDIAKRLDIVSLIDSICPKRNQGLSIGTYLLLAAINRATDPSSKSQFSEWFERTFLSRLLSVDSNALCSQRFWDNMSLWNKEDIEKFEIQFVKRIVKDYGIPTRCLVYDATNFFTYIDTMNSKASLAQRGHNKEKRNDLKIIGLSLLVSAEDEIPLFHEVYAGNISDSVQFTNVVNKLKGRYYEVFGQEADITIVFDRGNNSEDNIDLLASEENAFHYVGGLTQSQCKYLMDIPKTEFQPLKGEEFRETSAYRTKGNVFGREHTLVVADNPELREGQLQGIRINMEKCQGKLAQLQERLAGWNLGLLTKGKKPTKESVEKNIREILKPQWMDDLFKITVLSSAKYPQISIEPRYDQLAFVKDKYLGKSVLFTDQEEWSNEQIVGSYRSAWHVETAFRLMKNTKHLTVRPMWHWTNQKIEVHIFICILAFRLCSLLHKELKLKGVDVSINEMLNKLSEKKQVMNVYKKGKGTTISYSLTLEDDIVEKIVESQRLDSYKLS